jgi:CRP/FNR family transcriptional regulator, cyclic AMP receptor protein
VNRVHEVEQAFARTALLAELTPPERRRLASRATTRSYPAGTTILRQGDTSMAVYVILSGRVAVQIGAQLVREIGTDDFFGELGVLDDAPRSATIVALEPTHCALLAAWDIRRNPRIALGLLPILAQRLREAHAREPRSEAEWLAAVTGEAP